MEQITLTGTASYSKTITDSTGARRKTAHRTTLDVPLRSVTSEQAPVAALISGNREFKARWPRSIAEIRTLDGQLYKQPLDTQGQPLKPSNGNLGLSFSGFKSVEEAEEVIRRELGKFLLIDGEIWTLINEPHIRIGVGSRTLDITSTKGNHIGDHRLFALTEFDAAVEAQKEFNERYSFDSPTAEAVEILIPSAFTMPASAERVQAARDETDQAVAAVVAGLWMDRSPSSIHSAGLELLNLAGELSKQTGEPLLQNAGDGNV